MRRIVLFALVSILGIIQYGLYSCNNKNDNSKNIGESYKIENASAYRFLEVLKPKPIPVTDTTTFDNFELKNKLTKNQVALLNLNKVVSKEYFKFVENYELRYRINFSNKFQTVVISYLPNENELYTLMINYDKYYNVIDYKLIAYDEIAENFLRTESKIGKDNIKITDFDSSSGICNKKTSIYRVDNKGKIKASR